jgi:hypothetical protein
VRRLSVWSVRQVEFHIVEDCFPTSILQNIVRGSATGGAITAVVSTPAGGLLFVYKMGTRANVAGA